MKKILSVLTALLMLLTLFSCDLFKGEEVEYSPEIKFKIEDFKWTKHDLFAHD